MADTPETSEMRILRAQIRDFIQQNFLYGNGAATFEDDTSLIAQGIVDETGILELVLFVEETYGISVEESELDPANFDSVTSIATFVVSHLGPDLPAEPQ
jgi:acyl carrier protein